MKHRFLFLCGLFLAGATVTFAQQPGDAPRVPNAPPRPRRVSLLQTALDSDTDGVLSAQEIASAPAHLLLLDKNKDGKLTGDELRPPVPPVDPTVAEMVARLMEFDSDKSGTLSKDELPEQLGSIFAQADANRDNILTNAELTALVEKQEAEAKRREARKPAPPVPTGGKSGMRPMRVPPLQAALDSDKDGIITPTEIAVAATALLRLDTNTDGILDADELRPTPIEEKPEATPAVPEG